MSVPIGRPSKAMSAAIQRGLCAQLTEAREALADAEKQKAYHQRQAAYHKERQDKMDDYLDGKIDRERINFWQWKCQEASNWVGIVEHDLRLLPNRLPKPILGRKRVFAWDREEARRYTN